MTTVLIPPEQALVKAGEAPPPRGRFWCDKRGRGHYI